MGTIPADIGGTAVWSSRESGSYGLTFSKGENVKGLKLTPRQ
jgi:hypothetical protein